MISIDDFRKDHPFPQAEGIKSLFKFFRFNEDHPEYLSCLFEEANLYHSLPKDLNDPFECSPHFLYPNTGEDAAKLRKHLIKVGKESGLRKKDAEKMVSINMRNTEGLKVALNDSIKRVFNEVRVCCFTQNVDNLLFWSHYADSHKGLCVKFDSQKLPISASQKVKYQNEYPTVDFPQPKDTRAFRPLLTKSNVWKYEEEYRSLLYPRASVRLPKNDTSYILSNNVLKAVYFGANMDARHIEKVRTMIANGPFSPELWKVELESAAYGIKFARIT